MYKKQEWKDEIPDLSRPILDGTGKQKVDPQTGRPLWELVQEGTRITSSRLNHMEDGIQAAHEGQNAKITRDDGTAQLAPDRDINNWHKLGVYSFNEAHVNTPNGFVRGLIFVYEDAEGVTYQMAWETDSRLAVRTKNEVGRWTEWGGMGASDDLEKILAGYMPKTGGTFTGNVGFPGAATSNLYFLKGTGDNATYETYNNAIQAHWGLAMKTYDGTVTGLWDSRIGRWVTKGGFVVQSDSGNQWQVDDKGNQAMNGKLSANAGMDVKGDGPVQRLYGITHQYTEFYPTLNGGRSGYIGASDPEHPKNLTLSSDQGMLTLHGAQGVFANGRNILDELDSLKTSGVEKKQKLVDALNAKGIPASVNEDWDVLIAKLNQITVGVPSARVRMTVTQSASFKPYEDATVSSVLYYVIVTGLNFRAKKIMVLDNIYNSRAVSSFDSEISPRAYVTGSVNSYTVVYRDTLPQTRFEDIMATVTPTSFIFPVSYLDDHRGMDATVVAYG
ncbi:hypothetical protein M5X00_14030 [Paenibacillus alvei]|uniref:Tail fiber protein n=1 Tax=Paenibacillus alvei TaxID=44250 RepID=A0ABT4GX32_PAEAL|nr:hypothetical protein [Paenibacillus alvei]MCY9734620.1 hypothetical protein [Paenibacillus alvei]MCY9755362.1 hypothetical protein [Paenibacillus alvei]MCY9761254.1 hypothetical protein [Paenibacillus alvei]MCY9765701.1 hypothetical protein [Paenibacillus alvei]